MISPSPVFRSPSLKRIGGNGHYSMKCAAHHEKFFYKLAQAVRSAGSLEYIFIDVNCTLEASLWLDRLIAFPGTLKQLLLHLRYSTAKDVVPPHSHLLTIDHSEGYPTRKAPPAISGKICTEKLYDFDKKRVFSTNVVNNTKLNNNWINSAQDIHFCTSLICRDEIFDKEFYGFEVIIGVY